GEAIAAARPVPVEGLRRCRGASAARLASRLGGGGVCRSDRNRVKLAARLWCHDGNRRRPTATVRGSATEFERRGRCAKRYGEAAASVSAPSCLAVSGA